MFGWLKKRKKPKAPVLERVPRYCHPGKAGKRILCPEPDCKGITHVYNFKWSTLVCARCGESNNKYDWYLAPVDHRIDSRDHSFMEEKRK
jgi:hypothetical protein